MCRVWEASRVANCDSDEVGAKVPLGAKSSLRPTSASKCKLVCNMQVEGLKEYLANFWLGHAGPIEQMGRTVLASMLRGEPRQLEIPL